MKKNIRDYNIQIKTVYFFDEKDGFRNIYFRIKPSELSFFRRIFNNPWLKFKKCFNFTNKLTDFYSPLEFKTEIKPLKTYGDAIDYLKRQSEKFINLTKEIEGDTWDTVFND